MFKYDGLKLKCPVKEEGLLNLLKERIAKKLRIKSVFIKDPFIVRCSIDARKKPDIFYVYSVAFSLMLPEEDREGLLKKNKGSLNIYRPAVYKQEFEWSVNVSRDMDGIIKKVSCSRDFGFAKGGKRPVIIGTGPAGLFCGLMLARAGLCPLLLERGDRMDKRIEKTEELRLNGILDPASNIQFGEGGAGTFSDGKLFSHLHDRSGITEFILKTFVYFGAPSDILYDAKPHIGTDVLRKVIVNMREEMEIYGAEFRFRNTFISPLLRFGKLDSIKYSDENGIVKEMECSALVLAPGHSSRDTFINLDNAGIRMESKPFAAGFRVIHPQDLIDKAQYGIAADDLMLPPADYKLTAHTSTGRAVYSFCMCPGGTVINASSENGRLAVNGMSMRDRDSGYANSAIVAEVGRDIFGDGLFDGMHYQERLEAAAFALAGGKIPVSYYGDYKNGNEVSPESIVNPGIWNAKRVNLRGLFDERTEADIIEAMERFGNIIKGFSSDEAMLAGVETRTSSPVRILRDEKGESNIKGIYPCGEGAGYAGGITSAAADGVKVADKILLLYNGLK